MTGWIDNCTIISLNILTYTFKFQPWLYICIDANFTKRRERSSNFSRMYLCSLRGKCLWERHVISSLCSLPSYYISSFCDIWQRETSWYMNIWVNHFPIHYFTFKTVTGTYAYIGSSIWKWILYNFNPLQKG